MKSLLKWVAIFALPVFALLIGAPHFAVASAVKHGPTSLMLAGSTLAANMPTLLDLAKRLDPQGRIAPIVEILNQYNEVVEDMVVIEANSKTGHKTTIRSGIPGPTWRKLYQGVQPSKSTTVEVTDSFGMLENYAKLDKALAEMSGDAAGFRLSEERPILEGFAQEIAQTLFYGNEKTASAEFTGLAARYNSTTAENGVDNIINGGGVGSDNTSIWLVGWGEQTCHGIIPQGTTAGMSQNDKGVQTIQNSDGSMFEAYVTHYRQYLGLSLRDWRSVVRIANIDVSDLGTLANTANLVTWLTQATERVPNMSNARYAIYCNRYVREKLRLGILQKTSSQLTWDTVAGKRVLAFDGIPVRRCDQLSNAEAVVS